MDILLFWFSLLFSTHSLFASLFLRLSIFSSSFVSDFNDCRQEKFGLLCTLVGFDKSREHKNLALVLQSPDVINAFNELLLSTFLSFITGQSLDEACGFFMLSSTVRESWNVGWLSLSIQSVRYSTAFNQKDAI